jgi:hypothetical protein
MPTTHFVPVSLTPIDISTSLLFLISWNVSLLLKASVDYSEDLMSYYLMDFREFLFDEYQYVDKYESLYKGFKKKNIPQERLSMNTVTSQMKMFQTFFTELESVDEIRKSPFRRLSRERKKAVMRTKYDDPFFLRKEEFQMILSAQVPPSQEETRDAFRGSVCFRLPDKRLPEIDDGVDFCQRGGNTLYPLYPAEDSRFPRG